MRRMFIFAMAMWLGGFGAALAQTSSLNNSQSLIGQPTQQAGVAPTTLDEFVLAQDDHAVGINRRHVVVT